MLNKPTPNNFVIFLILVALSHHSKSMLISKNTTLVMYKNMRGDLQYLFSDKRAPLHVKAPIISIEKNLKRKRIKIYNVGPTPP